MEATPQRKRLQRNSAAQASDNSKSSDDEVEECYDVENISEAETEDDTQGGGIAPSTPPAHVVSKKTKCWLFFEVLPKGIKNIVTICFKCLCIFNLCGEIF